MTKTALVYSDAYGRFDYGPEHPLRMERLGLTWRLMEAYGLTALPNARVHLPEPATEHAVALWHTQDYLDVLKAANGGAVPEHAARCGLGPGDNPVFPGLWDAARLCAGGSLLAAELVASGKATRAFHFAGGLHHALPGRASGFCYVNDAVLAILYLKSRGLRVLYVDIDAHHGDGVQHAFYEDPEVLTISTHERGDYLFPGTGFVEEVGAGAALGYSVNLPLEPFTDASVYLAAFEEVVPPLVGAFKPDVVVAQLGIDSHRTDPLTHLDLDVQGFARAWTAAWAAMNGIELAAELPASFAEDARRYRFRGPTLWDPPEPPAGAKRLRAEAYVQRQVEALRRLVFPIHRL